MSVGPAQVGGGMLGGLHLEPEVRVDSWSDVMNSWAEHAQQQKAERVERMKDTLVEKHATARVAAVKRGFIKPITPRPSRAAAVVERFAVCEHCGQRFERRPTGRVQQFCTPGHRKAYWNAIHNALRKGVTA